MKPRLPAQSLSTVQAEYRNRLLAKLESGAYRLEDVPACLCGSTSAVQVADRDRYGIPIGVVLCSSCGLVRTTPRLAAENLPAFYESEYHGLHLSVPEPEPNYALYKRGQGSRITEWLGDLLPRRQLRVADIGAGTGQVLRELEQAVQSPVAGVGSEYSAVFVEAGQRAGSDIRHGGLETLTDGAPYDLILMSHVVEHFPDPITELSAIRNLGHDTTIFYVEVPGLLTIDNKPEYAYRLDRYLTVAHNWQFTLGTLSAVMTAAGFGILRGDERVRSAFRGGVSPSAIQPNGKMVQRTMLSLRRLDRPAVRVKRLWPYARSLAVTTARSVLPASTVQWLRSRVRH